MDKTEIKTEQIAERHQTKDWYDKSYKLLLILPAIALLFSIIYLVNFYNANGDIIRKDVSLTGGTTITVFDSKTDINQLTAALKEKLPDAEVRQLSDIRTGGQKGFFIETKEDAQKTKSALEGYLGYSLTEENSSIEFAGASLSSGFYQQLRNSVFTAFILMGCVVFLIFGQSWIMKGVALMLSGASTKLLIPGAPTIVAFSLGLITIGFLMSIFMGKPKKGKDLWIISSAIISSILIFSFSSNEIFALVLQLILLAIYTIYSVPSIAVILCAFADIIMTLVVVDITGVTLSSAGVIAFLMLIGYSVDTDILLTSRVMKKQEGTINERVFGAFKTGLTMSLTALASVGVSLWIVYDLSGTLRQIFTILLIGLLFDIFNTWITNASLIKWYAEAKHKHETHR